MSKIFRSWNPDQSILFPPSVLDLVSPGHLVHFVRDMAVTALQKPDFRRINLFLQRHLPSLRGPFVPVLRLRLERAGQRSRCRLREQVVEPVFGTIKKSRGFRQCLLRGVEKVAGEWSLICTAHNLRQLAAVRA